MTIVHTVRAQPRARALCHAFTLVELMIAISLMAVILAGVLFTLIALQRSYAATEQYATGQADQARLLDSLALDLRRGLALTGGATPYTMDPDGQGLKINVPDYYRFDPGDTQHLYPVAVDPIYDPTTETAFYSGSAAKLVAGTTPFQVVAYRFNPADGSITRSDPWLPRVSSGKGVLAAAPVVLATNMAAFPTITPDPADISGNTVHYGVTFRSSFLPLTNTTNGTEITLRNVTFIRSKNLAH